MFNQMKRMSRSERLVHMALKQFPSTSNSSTGEELNQRAVEEEGILDDDILNEPLFSSDSSDEYVPDTSSSSDENYKTVPLKRQKRKHLKEIEASHCTSMRPVISIENNSVDCEKAVDGSKESTIQVEVICDADIDHEEEIISGVADISDNMDTDKGNNEEDNVEGTSNMNTAEANVKEGSELSMEACKKKRKKGENVNPNYWKRNDNVAKRRRGEKYLGFKKQEMGKFKYQLVNEREARTLKDRCKCKRVRYFECDKITEAERRRLFTNFWKGIDSWEAKKATIVSLVDKSTPGCRRKSSDVEHSRKNVSFQYYLKVGNDRVRVCKKMFLNTFSLGERSVRSWVLKSPIDRVVEDENDIDDVQPGNDNIQASVGKDTTKRKDIQQFLESLPKMESHYCRANTSKNYLEPMWENKLQLFNEYQQYCNRKNIHPASRTLFNKVFKTQNIGFFLPKKDQCETCLKYKLGSVTTEEYNKHQKRKDESRLEKERDKERGQVSKEVSVYAIDVEKVLTCPNIKASPAYYKTKLKVHNWSVYNLATSDVTCYIWHEGNGDVSSNVFASMIQRFLNKEVEKKPDTKEIILWSDGCTYQNRCENVSNALLHFAVNKKITVYQKYLEVGHTQMEVDSVHSAIEKKIRNQEHYVPADYVRAVREARKQPKPYCVESLTYKDFLCFSDGYYKSIRPGLKKGDPFVTDLRCLKYKTDGHISYKVSFTDDWTELPRRPKPIKDVYTQLKPLYIKPLPIKERKFQDLQDLKQCLEEDYQPFYNGLAHDNCENQCDHIK